MTEHVQSQVSHSSSRQQTQSADKACLAPRCNTQHALALHAGSPRLIQGDHCVKGRADDDFAMHCRLARHSRPHQGPQLRTQPGHPTASSPTDNPCKRESAVQRELGSHIPSVYPTVQWQKHRHASSTGQQPVERSQQGPAKIPGTGGFGACNRQASLQEHRSVALSLRHARGTCSRQAGIEPSK
jgi:hypothetical protein